MNKPLSREQWLLNVSGLLAIAVVAWVNFALSESWDLLLLHSVFAVVFLISASRDPLGLPERFGALAMVALLCLTAASLVVYPDTITLILSVVMAASAPYHLSPRRSWLLLALANLIFWWILHSRYPTSQYLTGFLSLATLQGFAISSSLARRRDAESQQALERKNSELLAARALMAQQSQAEERLRIAGALHDTIGHRLTALRLQLEALGHQAPDALQEDLERCKTVAADLLEDVRAIVRDMPSGEAADLLGALRELAALTPGVTVTVTSELPDVDAPLAQELVFCFQEAVHNAVRHGGADRIELSYRHGAYEIRDNGTGPGKRVVRPGFGLRNIDQRLKAFGGHSELSLDPHGEGGLLKLQLETCKT